MNQSISVAIPWSLTHYLPLNGFHPLYQALFEEKPDWANLVAWDNVELSQRLGADKNFCSDMQDEVAQCEAWMQSHAETEIAKQYFEQFWSANLALTRLLPGDIEFHHTAPFPSLTRPYVFHCESFAPIFFPFAHQGTGSLVSPDALRTHYAGLFEDPLCLGIFSHLPDTLADISRFFRSSIIDRKLISSPIGLCGKDDTKLNREEKGALTEPTLLFINSANQNPDNFFRRGGHLALRCWQTLMGDSHAGKLILRCARPSDEALQAHGVDLSWLRQHTQTNILWIENFLSSAEIEELMDAAHFMLLPSASLHSVSIMQAMWAGAIPVVSDTIGTDLYVRDGKDGILLKGVRAANWSVDQASGVLVDRYADNAQTDTDLVDQMVTRIGDLLTQPSKFNALRKTMQDRAALDFNGRNFSQKFWQRVSEEYRHFLSAGRVTPRQLPKLKPDSVCFLDSSEWPRLFRSAPQPVSQLHTGRGKVTELGGCFIASPGPYALKLNDWSPLAEYVTEGSPHLYCARTIKELGGKYLGFRMVATQLTRRRRIVRWVSDRLMPYPIMFSAASECLKLMRRIRGLSSDGEFQKIVANDWANPLPESDIELMAQLENGMNVIRCGYMYYAIPKTEGEFFKVRADAGQYSVCLTGVSLKEVLHKVDDFEKDKSRFRDIILVEEGVSGFNLIRNGSHIYAIPQAEGEFSPQRVMQHGYSRIYVGETAAEVREAIQRSQA